MQFRISLSIYEQIDPARVLRLIENKHRFASSNDPHSKICWDNKINWASLDVLHQMALAGPIRCDYVRLKARFTASLVPPPGVIPPSPLCMLSREMRGYLAGGTYLDVDMVNAHPVIMAALTDHPLVHEYCNDREAFLALHKLGKRDFNIAVLCDPRLVQRSKPTLVEINRHVTEDLIPDLKLKFPRILAMVEQSSNNFNGSFMALVLQIIESVYLLSCVRFCNENKIRLGSLIHDGFLVTAEDIPDPAKFIADLEAYIASKVWSGINPKLKFCIKPMDGKIEEILSQGGQ